MAASVEEFRKLLQLIEQHPELREELRRYVLTEELLRLPAAVQEQGERLTRLERAIEELAAAVREVIALGQRHDQRLARLEEIAARQEALLAQHGERLTRLEEIAARQEGRIARLEEIAARQEALLAQHGERLTRLEEIAARQEGRIARLEEIAARQEALLAQHGERLTRLEEIAARQEALLAQHGERLARLEEIAARQEERLARQEERLDRHEHELVELRRVVTELTEAVRKLVDKAAEHDRKLDRLSRLYGAEVEARAAQHVLALLTQAGWVMRTRPRALPVNGEFDLVVQMHHHEHGTRWVVVEAKSRLHPRDVYEFAGKLGSKKIRATLRKFGVHGAVLPYLYGRVIDNQVDAVAATQGIGLVDEWGEAVAPKLLTLD